MAFFKFRKGGDEQPASPAAPESIEAMRKRARHRLIGASVLVLLGVVGFPMLFDSQPRPIAVDIPIEIPDKDKVKPLGNLPVAAPVAQTSGSPVAAPIAATAPTQAPSRTAGGVVQATPATPAKAEIITEAKLAEKPPEQSGAKAQALLDGKTPPDATKEAAKPATAPEARFVVQIGAFTDNAKAHEARLKIERAGLKTYAQVADTKDGKRIRVRVGPFQTKAEATKAAAKIKKLKLPAAILTL